MKLKYCETIFTVRNEKDIPTGVISCKNSQVTYIQYRDTEVSLSELRETVEIMDELDKVRKTKKRQTKSLTKRLDV